MKKVFLSFVLLMFAASFPSTVTAQEKPWMQYITPSGYFQAGYSVDNSFNNTFYIKRARVALSGELLNSERYGKFEYKVQAELANSPKLVDYWVKYTVRPYFGVQFGQFKTVLSIENSEYAPLKLEMIDYSLLVQRFVRMSTSDLSGISATGREMGLMFYGRFVTMADGHYLLRYEAGLFNGNGINKMDDDRSKDFIGRLMVYPMKDLSVGVSYWKRLYSPAMAAVNDPFDRLGVGIAYDSKYAYDRVEGKFGHTDGRRSAAAYATAGYKVLPNLNFGARYDYFALNACEPLLAQQYVTVGACWNPFKRLRLQLNYMYKMEPDRSVSHLVNFMSSISL